MEGGHKERAKFNELMQRYSQDGQREVSSQHRAELEMLYAQTEAQDTIGLQIQLAQLSQSVVDLVAKLDSEESQAQQKLGDTGILKKLDKEFWLKNTACCVLMASLVTLLRPPFQSLADKIYTQPKAPGPTPGMIKQAAEIAEKHQVKVQIKGDTIVIEPKSQTQSR